MCRYIKTTLTQHLTGSTVDPLAGLTALQLSLTSGSGSQSFESWEITRHTEI